MWARNRKWAPLPSPSVGGKLPRANPAPPPPPGWWGQPDLLARRGSQAVCLGGGKAGQLFVFRGFAHLGGWLTPFAQGSCGL